jgi:hypothetical protein
MHSTLDYIWFGIVAMFVGGATFVTSSTGAPPILADMPPDVAAQVITHQADMLRDQYLFFIVVLGSLAGATISYGIYPPPTPREMVLKMMVSTIAGICFTPMLATIAAGYFNLSINGQFVLPASAILAFVSWTALQLLHSFINKLLELWSQRVLKKNFPNADFERPKVTRHIQRAESQPETLKTPPSGEE